MSQVFSRATNPRICEQCQKEASMEKFYYKRKYNELKRKLAKLAECSTSSSESEGRESPTKIAENQREFFQ